jgi:hypothetical protein
MMKAIWAEGLIKLFATLSRPSVPSEFPHQPAKSHFAAAVFVKPRLRSLSQFLLGLITVHESVYLSRMLRSFFILI